MFLPIYDGAPMQFLKRPVASRALIGVNGAIYLLAASGLLGDVDRIDTALGAIPAVLTGEARLAPELAIAPGWVTPLTAMFLHASLFHLFGNMLFLWVFGDNVEDAMGSLRFLAFYLICGLVGTLLYVAMAPHSQAPLVGASGAVSGVVAAYLMLYPRVRVLGLVFNWLPLRIPALFCIGAWILLQIGMALFGGDPEVGWFAHVGGILAGAALVAPFKRREARLFGP